MSSPEGPKSRILARRAKFIAAAVTSMGVALEGCSSAQACLEPGIGPGTDTGVRDASDAEPQACLFAPPPEDSGRDAANPANADAADAARDGEAGG